jgi:hypothetical protein
MPVAVRARAQRCAAPAAALLVTCWGAFMLYGLTRYSTWPYPTDFISTVPAYLRTVAPAAQPYFLLIASWCVVAWSGARGDGPSRLLPAAAMLFAPFALFVANRGLQLRDLLPLVYLSYVALGIAAAFALTKFRELVDAPFGETALGVGVAVAAVAFAVHQGIVLRAENARASSTATGAENWDSPFVHQIADAMYANVPEGAQVLSSRLYFSSLHVETAGRFHVRQMPTVRVEIDPASQGLLVPRSNLFRWEDADLRPAHKGDVWLSLRKFPGKGYWVGLRQQELLEYIRAHEISYIVLTGEDAAFSSLHNAAYFSGHPAFTLLQRLRVSAADQAFIYAVDRDALFVSEQSMAISPRAAEALMRESGLTIEGVAEALGQAVRVTDGDAGLSMSEEWAAIAGVDLGVD